MSAGTPKNRPSAIMAAMPRIANCRLRGMPPRFGAASSVGAAVKIGAPWQARRARRTARFLILNARRARADDRERPPSASLHRTGLYVFMQSAADAHGILMRRTDIPPIAPK
jgi:hypothetical protein